MKKWIINQLETKPFGGYVGIVLIMLVAIMLCLCSSCKCSAQSNVIACYRDDTTTYYKYEQNVVYPNPYQITFTITYCSSFEMFDIKGVKQSKPINELEIGSYVAVLYNSDGKRIGVLKIIKL